jgi:hypothetical protein
MKKLLIALVALTLSTGAMAQFHHSYYGGGHGFYGPRVGFSVGAGYPYYPYGYYGAPYYGYPYYYGNNGGYESKLDLKIDEIKSKYRYKISLVKHDKALTHAQKKTEKKELKYEREQAIIGAKQDYYNKH